MQVCFKNFVIRAWRPPDREVAQGVIHAVVAQEYGFTWEPEGADRDAYAVEACYWETGGEFWVVEHQGQIVGTAGYYPVHRGHQAVEIRKMYLLPIARGQGLGRYLLQALEQSIYQRGFREIWMETASVLTTAIRLYEGSGYQPANGVETGRCDRVYLKRLPFP